MIRAIVMAFVVFTGVGLAGLADATVTISGTFSGEDSFGCYPAEITVSPQADGATLLAFGLGVVFYNPGDVDCVQPVDDVIAFGLTPGQDTTIRINVGRDRVDDTRVDALFFVAVADTQDRATQPVSFTDLLPSLKLVPPFIFPATRYERNECYVFTVAAYPETMAVTINVTSSVTNRIPDLELFLGRDCQTPLGPVDLPAGRSGADSVLLSVRRAPKNAGNAGTINLAADPSFTVAGQSYPPKSATLFFEPRTSLTLTAPATTNLDATGCHRATVRVGASDLDVITIRLYSGTGNARVYDSAGCLTTLTSIKLAPGKSRDVWIKTVAPDVPYSSLVADSTNAGNVEPTKPAAAGLTFYFTP